MYTQAKTYEAPLKDRLQRNWGGVVDRTQYSPLIPTGVDIPQLHALGAKLCDVPEGFTVHPRLKVERECVLAWWCVWDLLCV